MASKMHPYLAVPDEILLESPGRLRELFILVEGRVLCKHRPDGQELLTKEGEIICDQAAWTQLVVKPDSPRDRGGGLVGLGVEQDGEAEVAISEGFTDLYRTQLGDVAQIQAFLQNQSLPAIERLPPPKSTGLTPRQGRDLLVKLGDERSGAISIHQGFNSTLIGEANVQESRSLLQDWNAAGISAEEIKMPSLLPFEAFMDESFYRTKPSAETSRPEGVGGLGCLRSWGRVGPL